MSDLVADCPRCGASNITFDLESHIHISTEYGWQKWYEAFSVCRHCHRSTVFILAEKGTDESRFLERTPLYKVGTSANDFVRIEGFINIKNMSPLQAPEHVHPDVKAAFEEGAACLAINCFNAAAAMFRLSLDIATRALLPLEGAEGLNSKTRRDLGLRLPWLFDTGRLPASLRELSTCVKEDGNDGAHAGNLTKEDAEDLLDFSYALLERLYTEPGRLGEAAERRKARRVPKA